MKINKLDSIIKINVMEKVEMKPVNSTNIKAVGYSEEKKTLIVDFNNGKRYQYSPVTAEGHKGLMNADSIGSYFFKNIRNNENITTKKIEQ